VSDDWRPPYDAIDRRAHRVPEVGEVIGWDRRAWRVEIVTPRDDGRITLALVLLHGERHPNERKSGHVHLSADERTWKWHSHIYRNDRVMLCSCCGNPWPCLLADAQEEAEKAGAIFEERTSRAGTPGICYACGEVITQRQHWETYGTENADVPGYPAPRFHIRKKCWPERIAYMKRAAAWDPKQLDDEPSQEPLP
jgi:hypothetical protein